MSLIIEMVIKGSSPRDQRHSPSMLSPKKKQYLNIEVYQMTFILLDNIYDVSEISDIYLDDVECENKIKALKFLFKKANTLIGIDLDYKIYALKHVLEKYNEKLDIDYKTKICITDKSKNIVKKVNRYGIIDPDIEDITMKLFEERFEDIDDSKYTALTVQRIAKHLHKDDKLIASKPAFIAQIAKSFRIL
jgi:hypothetical protein